MKQSQIIIAVLVLATMIFGLTFAMIFLGQTPAPIDDKPTPVVAGNELAFEQVQYPLDGFTMMEWEQNASGFVDYWFHNPHPTPIRTGLDRKSCRCAGVEIFVLPTKRLPLISDVAVSFFGATGQSPLVAAATLTPLMHQLTRDITPKELLNSDTFETVPAGTVGWVRLRFKGEQFGRQALNASVWCNNPPPAPTRVVNLNLNLMYHLPIRVRPTLNLGSMSDIDLAAGVRKSIIVWSSTRTFFKIEANPFTKRSENTDPFLVGKPELLTPQELTALDKIHNTPVGETRPDFPGQVLCAYRVPITLLAVSPDGKTPCDLGVLRRLVVVQSPDVSGEPQPVVVTGRVRGVVEMGQEDTDGSIDFQHFPKSRGRSRIVSLHADSPEITLTFNRKRTPEFLAAQLSKPMADPETKRQSWQLKAEVLPGKASGSFPREKDPTFEDAALYLEAASPGKPSRTLRIPVRGLAQES